MEVLIGLVIIIAGFGYGIRKRYEIAKWLGLKIDKETDEETRRIELIREIEDCKRELDKYK